MPTDKIGLHIDPCPKLNFAATTVLQKGMTMDKLQKRVGGPGRNYDSGFRWKPAVHRLQPIDPKAMERYRARKGHNKQKEAAQ